jgi:hypothetical protein
MEVKHFRILPLSKALIKEFANANQCAEMFLMDKGHCLTATFLR